jgi:hypothetical protein
MLREMGLEPTRPCGHKILSLACLPFQHSRATERYYHTVFIFARHFSKKLFLVFFKKNLYEKNLQLEREESTERIGKVKLMGRIDNSNLTKERGVSRL